MHLIAIQGLRGGCGSTSIVAGLSSALAILHQPVLAIDLCPNNILGLHFGLPYDEPSAWAYRGAESSVQSIAAFRQQERVYVLPFDRQATRGYDPEQVVAWLEHALQQLAPASDCFVLLNIPASLDLSERLGQQPNLHWLHVLEADPACHVLLSHQLHDNHHLSRNHHWLINRLQPSLKLSHDLLTLWRLALGQLLVPYVIHEDEAVREALARKQLLGESAPHSLAMQDFLALANWCIKTVQDP
ncbi:cellulose biosynthesis protein BcsQ [Pseudomonas sp. sp1636]|uniref:cellulose biosynthesis protein BcsQ n=1 Tax=Pseudomonas sp. sp1636 TaxID=3036707 RepID=UPI0025A550FA|nr:cellulose biosynthesis protein BcsQ [Pseudomonas sp. sp1636]MDM8349906.1 cellulose biosynthesis protein BcsQ [Pseudomonas sp. sp1636]